RASSNTPSYRRARSSRFAAAISPRMPSATARLDKALAHPASAPAADRLECDVDAVAQARCTARGHQQRAGVEGDDRCIRLAAAPGEQCGQPLVVSGRPAAADLAQGHPVQPDLLRRELELFELAALERDRLR